MLVYIWFRFEWHFAIGAIATLILDTTKMIGFFALHRLEFNLTAIAALLTHDRLLGQRQGRGVRPHAREPAALQEDAAARDHRHEHQRDAGPLHLHLGRHLPRMLPMAIWGGSAVENFAVPMVFGIVVATTSSIFIAAPILLFLGDWWKHRQQREPATAGALVSP